jgi:2,3-bisphosphoglycerate-dependent phosphoglycerate mutase
MIRIFMTALFLVLARPADAGVDLHVAGRSFELGSDSFVYCFFSTVGANLETAGWGSRFPVVMNKLYEGDVSAAELPQLRLELTTIHEELRKFPPSKIVWDFEDRERRPPWGDNISTHITDLSNYFVTSDGKDLFEVLLRAVAEAERVKSAIKIE